MGKNQSASALGRRKTPTTDAWEGCARPRRRSRCKGSFEALAHPQQPSVRSASCGGARLPSPPTPQQQAGLGNVRGVRVFRPPSAQQRPLLPSCPAPGVRPLAALARSCPIRPCPITTPRPVPEDFCGNKSGTRRQEATPG